MIDINWGMCLGTHTWRSRERTRLLFFLKSINDSGKNNEVVFFLFVTLFKLFKIGQVAQTKAGKTPAISFGFATKNFWVDIKSRCATI